jgi:hypothetical protein
MGAAPLQNGHSACQVAHAIDTVAVVVLGCGVALLWFGFVGWLVDWMIRTDRFPPQQALPWRRPGPPSPIDQTAVRRSRLVAKHHLVMLQAGLALTGTGGIILVMTVLL